MQMLPLGRGGPLVSRIGLGMAALGRPAYITTGRADDFGKDRSEDAFRRRSWEVLDAAYAAGVRYLDCARSYGSAEAFVAGWLGRADPPDVVVGSKWGYTYVGAWDPAAAVHEVKDHSLATFERQHAETVALLGSHLRLYQVHSATLESGVLDDRALHEALARERDRGLRLGSQPRARLRPRPSAGRSRSDPGVSRSSARCRRPGTCWSRRSSPPWSRRPRPGGR